jgi:hypothetical protein
MTEELASGGALRAVRRLFSMGDNSLLKLENNFTVALALRGMCDRRFDFAQWISFLDFRFEQPAPRHIEKRSKRLHALRRSGVVVPFVDPDAAKPQIFENEKAGRNFQRLQAHRAKAHERPARRETICQAQRTVAADGI